MVAVQAALVGFLNIIAVYGCYWSTVCSLLRALHFNYLDFKDCNGIITSQQAIITEGIVRLSDGSLIRTVGRAVYDKQVHLWDSSTGKAADFTTSFDFSMQKMGNDPIDGDGFACFPAKNGSQAPAKFHEGCFGLISNCLYIYLYRWAGHFQKHL
nr:anti-H(O) lectin 2-like [Ziziphus jujuba var. spinosa]